MNNGFIALQRKILDWEWYTDPNTFRLFIHLLLKANHAPKKWQGQIIDRGQVITGRITLSKELKLSEQQIRTSINKLKKTEEITSTATSHYTLITLVNYNSYQDKPKTATNKANIQQPADNQPVTTNNNITTKQVKRVKAVAFTRPAIDQIKDYIQEKQYSVDPDRFFNYYESNGWKVGRNSMKSWKAALTNWQTKEAQNETHKKHGNNGNGQSILGSDDLSW